MSPEEMCALARQVSDAIALTITRGGDARNFTFDFQTDSATPQVTFTANPITSTVTILNWTTVLSERDQRDVLALAEYELRCARDRKAERSGAQRRARRLLRTFLTPGQTRELHQRHYFHVEGNLGGLYRLWPKVGLTEKVEQHGKNAYARVSFCLHDQGHELPRADVTIAHLLLLRADEGAFLAEANAYPMDTHMWDGAYLREMIAARRERAERQVAA